MEKITSILSKNSKSTYVPPGFAHGFCGLSKENYVIYSCTKYREEKYEVGISYNDKDLKINWPVKTYYFYKDRNNLKFSDFIKKINDPKILVTGGDGDLQGY